MLLCYGVKGNLALLLWQIESSYRELNDKWIIETNLPASGTVDLLEREGPPRMVKRLSSCHPGCLLSSDKEVL